MVRYELDDNVGRLAALVTENWLLSVRETNPAILDMLRDKNLRPARHLNPWSGEFAGKYLTGCALIYSLTGDGRLKKYARRFIAEMLMYQEQNGYLGAFDSDHQLTGSAEAMRDPVCDRTVDIIGTWDCWAHYHMMTALMKWHALTGEEAYIEAVKNIAKLFINKFYAPGGPRIIDAGSAEMNLAVYHSFAALYNRTGKAEYLEFAKKVEEDTADPRAGDYLGYSRRGFEFYRCPKPRWESLHIIMGYAEMYRATGDKKYLDAVRQITRSILKTDIHNTGAFSTNEQAVGNPYSGGAVETCCVVAFNALAAELYRLSPEATLADFLERSLYNAVMGSFSPTGRWSTYDTPMDGCRRANYHSIVFQSRPGSPELNCCSVNAPRGLGELYEWGCYEADGVTYINWYGRSAVNTGTVRYSVSGNYPYENEVKIKIETGAASALALRIPAWSKNTKISLGGKEITAEAGKYLNLGPVSAGDLIELRFDFTPRSEEGKGEKAGRRSVFYGPLLLGFDSASNPAFDFDAIPEVTDELLAAASVSVNENDDRLALTLPNGVILNDFYNLGRGGSFYRTWI